MLTVLTTLSVDTSWIDYLTNSELLLGTLLASLGGWTIAVVAVIIFIESGVLFPLLPGDALLFALGIVHERIPVSLWVTFVVLSVCAVLGNIVGYWLGATYGRGLFKSEARFLSYVNLKKAEDFFDKYGGRALVLARWVPFVRTFLPIVAGIARFKYRTFLLWNIVGALTWIGAFLVAGMGLGQISAIKNNVEIIAVAMVMVSVIPMSFEVYRRYRARRNKLMVISQDLQANQGYSEKAAKLQARKVLKEEEAEERRLIAEEMTKREKERLEREANRKVARRTHHRNHK